MKPADRPALLPTLSSSISCSPDAGRAAAAAPRDGQVFPLAEVRDAGLSRRFFCQSLLAGAAVALIPGCGEGMTEVDAGALPDLTAAANPDLSPAPDMASGGDLATNRDLAQSPDMAQANGTCPGNARDTAKKPGDFAAGTATYFLAGNLFVCRDGGGLFALTAVCTHAGTTVSVSNGGFLCPNHGSRFALDGTVTGGPAISPLKHYGLCVTGAGNLGVDTATTVPAAMRFNP